MPTKRRAPAEAQQLLGELMDKLPYEPEFPHDFDIVIYLPQAIHVTQQVCWAIKQHNEMEEEKKQRRWEEQIAQGKKPGGTVTLPDYVANKIPWVLKYKLLDDPKDSANHLQAPGYQPRTQLYADLPRGRRKTKGVMAKLLAELSPRTPITPSAPPDPFEKWLADASPERRSGVDESGRNG